MSLRDMSLIAEDRLVSNVVWRGARATRSSGFVLDSSVREVHLVVEVRQLMFACPLADLIWRSIGVSVVVVVVTVALVKPTLSRRQQSRLGCARVSASSPRPFPNIALTSTQERPHEVR